MIKVLSMSLIWVIVFNGSLAKLAVFMILWNLWDLISISFGASDKIKKQKGDNK